MDLLASTAYWGMIVMIVSIGAITLWKLFSTASFRGLLRSSDGSLSPARMQMLVLTVLAALQYLLAVIHDPSRLPTPPMGLVAVVGGSQIVYLAAKAWSLFGLKRNLLEGK